MKKPFVITIILLLLNVSAFVACLCVSLFIAQSVAVVTVSCVAVITALADIPLVIKLIRLLV